MSSVLRRPVLLPPKEPSHAPPPKPVLTANSLKCLVEVTHHASNSTEEPPTPQLCQAAAGGPALSEQWRLSNMTDATISFDEADVPAPEDAAGSRSFTHHLCLSMQDLVQRPPAAAQHSQQQQQQSGHSLATCTDKQLPVSAWGSSTCSDQQQRQQQQQTHAEAQAPHYSSSRASSIMRTSSSSRSTAAPCSTEQQTSGGDPGPDALAASSTTSSNSSTVCSRKNSNTSVTGPGGRASSTDDDFQAALRSLTGRTRLLPEAVELARDAAAVSRQSALLEVLNKASVHSSSGPTLLSQKRLHCEQQQQQQVQPGESTQQVEAFSTLPEWPEHQFEVNADTSSAGTPAAAATAAAADAFTASTTTSAAASPSAPGSPVSPNSQHQLLLRARQASRRRGVQFSATAPPPAAAVQVEASDVAPAITAASAEAAWGFVEPAAAAVGPLLPPRHPQTSSNGYHHQQQQQALAPQQQQQQQQGDLPGPLGHTRKRSCHSRQLSMDAATLSGLSDAAVALSPPSDVTPCSWALWDPVAGAGDCRHPAAGAELAVTEKGPARMAAIAEGAPCESNGMPDVVVASQGRAAGAEAVGSPVSAASSSSSSSSSSANQLLGVALGWEDSTMQMSLLASPDRAAAQAAAATADATAGATTATAAAGMVPLSEPAAQAPSSSFPRWLTQQELAAMPLQQMLPVAVHQMQEALQAMSSVQAALAAVTSADSAAARTVSAPGAAAAAPPHETSAAAGSFVDNMGPMNSCSTVVAAEVQEECSQCSCRSIREVPSTQPAAAVAGGIIKGSSRSVLGASAGSLHAECSEACFSASSMASLPAAADPTPTTTAAAADGAGVAASSIAAPTGGPCIRASLELLMGLQSMGLEGEESSLLAALRPGQLSSPRTTHAVSDDAGLPAVELPCCAAGGQADGLLSSLNQGATNDVRYDQRSDTATTSRSLSSAQPAAGMAAAAGAGGQRLSLECLGTLCTQSLQHLHTPREGLLAQLRLLLAAGAAGTAAAATTSPSSARAATPACAGQEGSSSNSSSDAAVALSALQQAQGTAASAAVTQAPPLLLLSGSLQRHAQAAGPQQKCVRVGGLAQRVQQQLQATYALDA